MCALWFINKISRSKRCITCSDMVEVRGVEPLHKNKKCIAVQSLFAFCVHFRVQNIVKEIVHHVVNSLFFIGHCVLVDFF